MAKAFFSLMLGLIAGCAAPPPSAAVSPMTEATDLSQAYRVAVLGDSISAGINADVDITKASFGWVDLWTGRTPPAEPGLPPDFNFSGILGDDAALRNFSKPGWRITNWLAPSAFQPIADFQPDLLVVFIGGNDLLEYIRNGDFPQTEVELLNGKIDRLFRSIEQALPRAKVLVLGYYDLFDGMSSRLPEALSVYRGLSEWGRQANELLKVQAQSRGFSYLDLAPAFSGHGYGRELGGEGLTPAYVRLPLRSFDIHPGTHGHRAIAEAVSQFLLVNPPRAVP